ncbi:TRAP transporter large permease [Donghicola sp.]|jgi:tripartite ATP-independent transporter DctM subunit|uniref:TRAP transporter large permease n=1 Tax=Donghicola sp. TaxID=1929294 RepID=UPI0025D7C567|nr:TRAP transporter large permease [Donghicola sp.]MCT4576479.1 TRAP transporter large permease [Donghicola sp.]
MITVAFLVMFFGLLILGLPVAYTMLVSSALYILMAGLPEVQLTLRASGGIESFSLLAIPMFLLAGNLMNGLGVTERIFNFAGVLVRHITGGLGHVNVLASIIFAGMSGSSVADAGGLGAVEIKAMEKAGYSRKFSSAITAASATMGPIIPPSITLVVYGFLAEESVGRLFLGGALPGLLVGFALMVMVYILVKTGREDAPKLPRATLSEVNTAFWRALPALLAPVILLGGILAGIFTPTEASVVVVLYILLIGSIALGFNIRSIWEAILGTVRTSASTLFIIAVSAVFGWIISIQRLPVELVSLMEGLFVSKAAAIAVVIAILLIVGMFMEVLAALVLLVPTLLAIATTFNIDTVHLGVTVVVTMMIGTITPPVGLVLYTVMSVAGIKMGELTRALLPFYLTLVIVALLVAFVPQITMFLPDLLMPQAQ